MPGTARPNFQSMKLHMSVYANLATLRAFASKHGLDALGPEIHASTCAACGSAMPRVIKHGATCKCGYNLAHRAKDYESSFGRLVGFSVDALLRSARGHRQRLAQARKLRLAQAANGAGT